MARVPEIKMTGVPKCSIWILFVFSQNYEYSLFRHYSSSANFENFFMLFFNASFSSQIITGLQELEFYKPTVITVIVSTQACITYAVELVEFLFLRGFKLFCPFRHKLWTLFLGQQDGWVDEQCPGQVQLCGSTRLDLQRGHAEVLKRNCLWSLGVKQLCSWDLTHWPRQT